MQYSHFWGAHPIGVGALKAPHSSTGPTGGCRRDTLNWGVLPSGPGQSPIGVSTARSPLGLLPLGHPIMVCLYLSLSRKDLARGPGDSWWLQETDVPSCQMCCHGLTVTFPGLCSREMFGSACLEVQLADSVRLSEYLCLALLIPQVGQSSPVLPCCGFTDLTCSCLKKIFWF